MCVCVFGLCSYASSAPHSCSVKNLTKGNDNTKWTLKGEHVGTNPDFSRLFANRGCR